MLSARYTSLGVQHDESKLVVLELLSSALNVQDQS